MAEITAGLVKELREKTGVGMMDCKKALTETNGDLEAAADLLRKKGMAKAASKASRAATEGLVGAHVTTDGKKAAMVEVNCETDFVARNEEFVELVKNAAKFLEEKAPNQEGTGDDIDGMTSWEGGLTVGDLLKQKIQKIGENIRIRRYTRYELSGPGVIASYIHLGGKIGVLVELGGTADEDLAKDVAMHIAASQPSCVSRDEVNPAEVEKEREILLAQPDLQSKPENVREKMVVGRLNKFYEQICLLEQPFVKDPGTSVGDMLKKKGATVNRFTRYGLGEGLEKKADNFAEEVASYMKG